LMPSDWVEVLPAAEIAKTLDANGCLEALPFMPEMAAYCGRRFKIKLRAERTCAVPWEPSHRELTRAVVLDELRCDGGFHGGCQLGCMIYWKEAWLRRTNGPAPEAADAPVELRPEFKTRRSDDGTKFQCQGTELFRASTPGPSPYSPWQYVRMLQVKTLSVRELSAIFGGVLVRKVARAIGRGKPKPNTVVKPAAQPSPPLGLKPGDLVRVKTREEIAATLDANSKQRGLSFADTMYVYAGRTMRVAACVEHIIDERTGKLREFAPGTVLLEGACCDRYRGCARNMPMMWRDVWLERVTP
jgi:hypothetical protein